MQYVDLNAFDLIAAVFHSEILSLKSPPSSLREFPQAAGLPPGAARFGIKI
jgi:hypothetical protein